jgi:hypothetical protein
VKQHRFAWDGLSFLVPETWNLSCYEHSGDSRHVEMEDDYSRRMEAEWIRLTGKLDPADIQRRYAKSAQKIVKNAKNTSAFKSVPKDWVAFIYTFEDKRKLLTAYYIAPKQKTLAFFTFHIDAAAKQQLAEAEAVIRSAQVHAGVAIPWEFYDVAFELSPDFKLVESSFLSGRKQMVFEWKSRRLYLWFISLAEMALRGRELNAWAVEELNAAKGLRGPVFITAPEGKITTRRNRLRPLGHIDQLQRLCFRYQTGVEHVRDKNQIFLWAFHYRKSSDLAKLEGFRRIPPGG